MGCLRYEGYSELRARSGTKASWLLDLLEFLSIVEEVFGWNCKLQEFCYLCCVGLKGCRWNCWTESCFKSKSLHFLRIRYRFTLQISWTAVGNSGFSIIDTRGKIMQSVIGFIKSIEMSVSFKKIVHNVVIDFLMRAIFEGKLTEFLKWLIQCGVVNCLAPLLFAEGKIAQKTVDVCFVCDVLWVKFSLLR